MLISELLRQAKALIEKPENWCREHYAMNEGRACNLFDSPTPTQYCAEGARMKVCREFRKTKSDLHQLEACIISGQASVGMSQFLKEAALQLYNQDLVYVNDNYGHSAVMRCYDIAIELAEKEEKKPEPCWE